MAEMVGVADSWEAEVVVEAVGVGLWVHLQKEVGSSGVEVVEQTSFPWMHWVHEEGWVAAALPWCWAL